MAEKENPNSLRKYGCPENISIEADSKTNSMTDDTQDISQYGRQLHNEQYESQSRTELSAYINENTTGSKPVFEDMNSVSTESASETPYSLPGLYKIKIHSPEHFCASRAFNIHMGMLADASERQIAQALTQFSDTVVGVERNQYDIMDFFIDQTFDDGCMKNCEPAFWACSDMGELMDYQAMVSACSDYSAAFKWNTPSDINFILSHLEDGSRSEKQLMGKYEKWADVIRSYFKRSGIKTIYLGKYDVNSKKRSFFILTGLCSEFPVFQTELGRDGISYTFKIITE